jgi:hypothetical protein
MGFGEGHGRVLLGEEEVLFLMEFFPFACTMRVYHWKWILSRQWYACEKVFL